MRYMQVLWIVAGVFSMGSKPAMADTRVTLRTLPGEGGAGLERHAAGSATMRSLAPARVTVYGMDGTSATYAGSYTVSEGDVYETTVTVSSGVHLRFRDQWKVANDVVVCDRRVTVAGNGEASFVTSLMMETSSPLTLGDLQLFAPGAMYGAPEHIAHDAPGGMDAYHKGAIEIREDMLPAPMLGIYSKYGGGLCMLNLEPQGDSLMKDFSKPEEPQADPGFRFGAFGVSNREDGVLKFGYWFPGSLGYLSGDKGKYQRSHPLQDGLTQHYRIAFRLGLPENFHDFYSGAWRWAWDTLKPKVDYHDIDLVRRSLVDMLAEQVETHDGQSGLPNSINMKNNPRTRDPKAVLGFTGKNLEAAVFLLMDSARGESPRDAEHRAKALAIIDSFLKLKVAPPEGEGFDMETGELRLALPHDKVIYLRSFSDDMKILLRGYEFEKARGHEHPEWLAWCRDFADWLLTQQQPAGGFPRAWEPVTGKVAVAAPQSSYNPVPMLVHLTELTGDEKYAEAAIKAAEFCWVTEQTYDNFVGGTIDNPNIIDKEAATLSTEAYLALYDFTGKEKWLRRAEAAADHAETYIYIWDVPMPADAAPEELHWVKGVSTVGLNVVSTSRPGLADSFMAFDVDELVRLYRVTGKAHYLDVARLLLHNSNNMTAVPGRELNMPGPGWTSEHIAVGPPHRGQGLNRLWLPWVATCRLNGIIFTEQSDIDLFNSLKSNPTTGN